MRWNAGAVLGALTLALALAPGAHAQTAKPQTVEEIVVTGTRLPKADLTADSPIVTVSQEAIQQRGSLTLEEVLNRLPQMVPSFSSAANNPSANGASYANLRGLGVSRNLVLLDGRRIVGANASSSVDLNTVPEPLIDRVEIVTGGASAVYGADAVAGVINIITKKRYDGFEAQVRTLVSEHGDGRQHELTLTYGHAFDRGAVMGSFGWGRRDEIGKGARDFSAQAGGASPALPGGAYVPLLTNLPSQSAVDAVFSGYGAPAGAVSRRGGFAGFGFNADGTLIGTGLRNNPALDAQNYRGPLDQVAKAIYPDVYSFNFEPFNKLILPLNRYSGMVGANLDLTPHVALYAQAMGTHYSASTALAPTPAPTDENPLLPGSGIGFFTIPVTNPFIPTDLARLLASRTGNSPALSGIGPNEDFQYKFRAVALGARQSTNSSDTVNLLGGLRADLPRDWQGEVSFSWGRYARGELQEGLLSVRRFEQLMYSPTGGTEFCDGGVNPFGGAIGASCRNFLRVTASYSTRVQQSDAIASASGPLLDLPAGPLRAAVGAEYRSQSFRFVPPSGLSTGEIAGFFFLDRIEGRIRTRDLFAELAVPLLKDRPLARAVDLTLGWRRSDEVSGQAIDSYKAELGWSIDRAWRLRSSFQRAERAPDIFERFQPPLGQGGLGDDPCSAGNPARVGAVQTLCRQQAAALGFTLAQADAYDQLDNGVTVIQSGNPKLSPERARTVTVGAVWGPGWRSDWVGDLHATLDWYDIEIDNAIGYLDPQLALNDCYNVSGANPSYDPANPACGQIARSSGDFSISHIASPRVNQSAIATAGVDASLTFRTDLAALGGRSWLGRLDTTVALAWLQKFTQKDSPIQRQIDFAGTIADATTGYESLPRWKGLLDVAWTSGPLHLAGSGRYIDTMQHRLLRIGTTDPVTGAGSAWYWDLSGAWAIDRRAELRAGILNLLDRSPEIYKPAVDANTDPSTYDVIGRRFWIALILRL